MIILLLKKGFDKPKADSVIKCLEYVNKIILPKITKGYSDFSYRGSILFIKL